LPLGKGIKTFYTEKPITKDNYRWRIWIGKNWDLDTAIQITTFVAILKMANGANWN
jgi:hypothetical protein